METQEKVLKAKKQINKSRLKIKKVKEEVGKLGEETTATIPEDLKMMFAGKLIEMMIKDNVRAGNMMTALQKAHGAEDEHITDYLNQVIDQFSKNFDKSKNQLKNLSESHPLWERFSGVRGFSSAQLALVMSQIKDIEKFDTASKLMIYAGVGCVEGMAVTKANIEKIKAHYLKQGKEFKGFNTILSGRMYVISESLIKQKGFFYNFATKMRERLAEQAINQGRTELRDNKGEQEHYMLDKKNMSLKLWTQKNAMRRISRTLLHLIWHEWRTIKGLPTRIPYPVDYLGHDKIITLDEVLAYDKKVKEDLNNKE